jgi:hypothetical protein
MIKIIYDKPKMLIKRCYSSILCHYMEELTYSLNVDKIF